MCPQLGLVVPPHALSLPFESVKELGDYWCEVTVRNVHYQCITFIVILSLFASFFLAIYMFFWKMHQPHIRSGETFCELP